MKDQQTTSQWEETLKKQINEPATFEKLWNEALKRECVVYEVDRYGIHGTKNAESV